LGSGPGSLTLTEAQYDGLPDRVRKLIEVIDGTSSSAWAARPNTLM
jgi:hypothetical protein